MRRTLSFVILLILVVAGFLLVKGRYGKESCGLEPVTACQQIQEVLDYNNPSSLKVENYKGRVETFNPQETVDSAKLDTTVLDKPLTVVTE